MIDRPITRWFLCCVAAIQIVVATNCGDDGIRIVPGPGTPVAFQTLDDSRLLRVRDPAVRVFRDGADWEAFWWAHVAAVDGSGNPAPPPAVAFDREMLIGAFWGNRGSGCGNLVDSIGPIVRYDDRVEVSVGELPFLGPCATIVEPLQIVITERINEPVVFRGLVP